MIKGRHLNPSSVSCVAALSGRFQKKLQLRKTRPLLYVLKPWHLSHPDLSTVNLVAPKIVVSLLSSAPSRGSVLVAAHLRAQWSSCKAL